jgi:hypothetical protein
MVGFPSLPQLEVMLWGLSGLIVMSPGGGVNAGILIPLARACSCVMFLYRNLGIVPSIPPALLRVPSHSSHPIEQP